MTTPPEAAPAVLLTRETIELYALVYVRSDGRRSSAGGCTTGIGMWATQMGGTKEEQKRKLKTRRAMLFAFESETRFLKCYIIECKHWKYDVTETGRRAAVTTV